MKKTYIPQQTASVNTSVSTATFGGQAAAAYNAQNTVAVTNNYSQSYTTPVSAPTPAVQAKPKTGITNQSLQCCIIKKISFINSNLS